MSRVQLSKADVSPLEEEYVLEALRSGWVTPSVPQVDAFELAAAERVGVAHAVALASGTTALGLALGELGAAPGTAVVLPTMSPETCAAAVRSTGAEPVLVDSRTDGTLDPVLLLEAVEATRRRGMPVTAVMSVDLYGRCADYDELLPGLEARGIPLLVDATESFGASYRGRPAGSIGHAAVLSFNGTKLATTSGGGMLLSEDTALVERLRCVSAHARETVGDCDPGEVGDSHRLSNVHAALGRAQLARLDAMIERRRVIRRRYVEALAPIPGLRFLGADDEGGRDHPDESDTCSLTCVELDPQVIALSPDEVVASLGARDVEARRLCPPLHLRPLFAGHTSFLTGVSERLFRCGLVLPSSSALTDEDVTRVADALLAVLSRSF